MKTKQNGFTLLELLVVVVIIGLLASYVGPKYFGQIGKSRTQTAKAQVDAFDKALEQYRIDVGHFPTTAQGLNALVAGPAGEGLWKGPYLKKAIPQDPWGKAYLYTSPGSDPTHEFEIISYGKDGQPGGADEDSDVTSWN
ncbi:type II secretion system major pseudopilin GspG [Undibacterium sp. Jales W-56]|uniref:type II secretion system major pseudopilin GspG n=1 Tax=Undibacterium sp. Jales W-56 TaxID=2897325 RepID=UPI0021D1F10A|nr:type II secretion system major pseudopilin GspG [Undibacterium sp. Jales W-56]MCU6433679.1 type II secretion system major pseudopilin GspG [Undibacterium sp. Jales W-56]